jgi:hypothetical protein
MTHFWFPWQGGFPRNDDDRGNVQNPRRKRTHIYIYIYIPRNRTYARFHGRSQERKPLVINDTFSLPMTWQGRTFAPMTAEWERMYICSTHTNERDIHTARVNQLKPGRTAPARANQLQPGHHEGWMISDQETIFHWVAHPYHPYLSCFSALPTN